MEKEQDVKGVQAKVRKKSGKRASHARHRRQGIENMQEICSPAPKSTGKVRPTHICSQKERKKNCPPFTRTRKRTLAHTLEQTESRKTHVVASPNKYRKTTEKEQKKNSPDQGGKHARAKRTEKVWEKKGKQRHLTHKVQNKYFPAKGAKCLAHTKYRK